MRVACLLIVLAGCVSIRIDPDGAQTLRTLGAVRVETMACTAAAAAASPTPLEAPVPNALAAAAQSRAGAPPCMLVQGVSLSEAAGGLIAGLLGALFGR